MTRTITHHALPNHRPRVEIVRADDTLRRLVRQIPDGYTVTAPTVPTLSIHQPWAWLLTAGRIKAQRLPRAKRPPIKVGENRSWLTHHRGTVAIHAAKNTTTVARIRRDPDLAWLHDLLPDDDTLDAQRGNVIALADLDACLAVEHLRDDLKRNPFLTGPYVFTFRAVAMLPFPDTATGKQGLWRWPLSHELVDLRREHCEHRRP